MSNFGQTTTPPNTGFGFGQSGGAGDSRFGDSPQKQRCGIEMKIKFKVENATITNPDGSTEAGRYFFPIGERVTTKEGDKWGSKGQGGKSQEITIKMLGCKSGSGLSIEVTSEGTTLNQTAGAESDVNVKVTAWFDCCVDGDDNCKTCCTEDNMTSPGGGDNNYIGAWRTGLTPNNKLCRTPQYAIDFKGDSPSDAEKDLRDSMKGLVYSDLISDVAKSYQNTSCD